jgi:8-oxo-dGTP diphosphatase
MRTHALIRHQPSSDLTAIFAAGGIICGQGDREGKIAVVRRARYAGEVGLPKGKVKGNEKIEETAQRETFEETGMRVRLIGYAGSTHYFVHAIPKVVFYYLMEVISDSGEGPTDVEEIKSVDWLTPNAAVAAFTYREDGNLVSAVFGIPRETQR